MGKTEKLKGNGKQGVREKGRKEGRITRSDLLLLSLWLWYYEGRRKGDQDKEVENKRVTTKDYGRERKGERGREWAVVVPLLLMLMLMSSALFLLLALLVMTVIPGILFFIHGFD